VGYTLDYDFGTPGALMTISALYLFDYYVRHRHDAGWHPRQAARNAGAFGLVIGLQAPDRPMDLAVVSPIAVTYAAFVIISMFRAPRRSDAVTILVDFLAFCVPLALYFGFNELSYGTMFGRYFCISHAKGLDPIVLPQQLYSHLLDSSAYFAEGNADWLRAVSDQVGSFDPGESRGFTMRPIQLARLPLYPRALILVAVGFLPFFAFFGPPVMRVVGAAAVIQFILYCSDHDILPTGTFRFCNFNISSGSHPLPYALSSISFGLRLHPTPREIGERE
jgi:hypothetical protein